MVMRLLALLLLSLLGSATAAADRPNILWIMSDDHAATAVGAYGGRLAGLDPTPNLDEIAEPCGSQHHNFSATTLNQGICRNSCSMG